MTAFDFPIPSRFLTSQGPGLVNRCGTRWSAQMVRSEWLSYDGVTSSTGKFQRSLPGTAWRTLAGVIVRALLHHSSGIC